MQPNDDKPDAPEPNEGEGNRTVARRYDEAVTNYPPERAKEAAERAKRALETDEAAELARAEEEAKKKASDIELDKEIPEKRADVDEE